MNLGFVFKLNYNFFIYACTNLAQSNDSNDNFNLFRFELIKNSFIANRKTKIIISSERTKSVHFFFVQKLRYKLSNSFKQMIFKSKSRKTQQL